MAELVNQDEGAHFIALHGDDRRRRRRHHLVHPRRPRLPLADSVGDDEVDHAEAHHVVAVGLQAEHVAVVAHVHVVHRAVLVEAVVREAELDAPRAEQLTELHIRLVDPRPRDALAEVRVARHRTWGVGRNGVAVSVLELAHAAAPAIVEIDRRVACGWRLHAAAQGAAEDDPVELDDLLGVVARVARRQPAHGRDLVARPVERRRARRERPGAVAGRHVGLDGAGAGVVDAVDAQPVGVAVLAVRALAGREAVAVAVAQVDALDGLVGHVDHPRRLGVPLGRFAPARRALLAVEVLVGVVHRRPVEHQGEAGDVRADEQTQVPRARRHLQLRQVRPVGGVVLRVGFAEGHEPRAAVVATRFGGSAHVVPLPTGVPVPTERVGRDAARKRCLTFAELCRARAPAPRRGEQDSVARDLGPVETPACARVDVDFELDELEADLVFATLLVVRHAVGHRRAGHAHDAGLQRYDFARLEDVVPARSWRVS